MFLHRFRAWVVQCWCFYVVCSHSVVVFQIFKWFGRHFWSPPPQSMPHKVSPNGVPQGGAFWGCLFGRKVFDTQHCLHAF